MSDGGLTPEASWTLNAACAAEAPQEMADDLFVQGAAQRDARRICFACDVRLECLAEALQTRAPFGVWGGMTERERRALLRRRGDVASWWDEIRTDEELTTTFSAQRLSLDDGRRRVRSTA
ncbi:transcription factor WhiB [Beutenbergia cavernae DSM 12333]|uniref:Transcriptional regulator WhiB n=1 Tax=Beutenbergia cavernae (strain ATCC BAA-8 / DSM 12333 / CCUG 43141 / JCM 11478 / NBRC 16432 / NCIMB 13614 / HKI 0122) TaxID=471853 RepID=C5BXX3_BEUC1|nr:WhiB family transcriptional regulator [Beutenbergia cavernae]ACQ78867.1 transcription factor WhiB [Beutenbergia cavernae DSM 12333]